MYTLIRKEDYNTFLIKHFMCDSTSDLDTIVSDFQDKNELHAGWTGLVATSSGTQKYVLLQDEKTWTKMGSGGSSPTPGPDPEDEYIWDGGGVSGW